VHGHEATLSKTSVSSPLSSTLHRRTMRCRFRMSFSVSVKVNPTVYSSAAATVDAAINVFCTQFVSFSKSLHVRRTSGGSDAPPRRAMALRRTAVEHLVRAAGMRVGGATTHGCGRRTFGGVATARGCDGARGDRVSSPYCCISATVGVDNQRFRGTSDNSVIDHTMWYVICHMTGAAAAS
jgi:hypothetical protein